ESYRRGSCPMKHPLALALAVALTTSLAACSQSEANTAESGQSASQDGTTVNESSNPFFTESSLPLHYPAFDKITDADFGPGFDRGMADHLKEVEAIA